MPRARHGQISTADPLITTASPAVFGGRSYVVKIPFLASPMNTPVNGLWIV
ncbi:hypothetical protein [Oceanospirillum linum]|uniref:hypothetical protein n=1 Tax=Oceanospirillum linum TaxID=966 RepID=UPI00089E4D2A|nr:hypothetical protein [Oceanospirillum linum]SEF39755.1 hypothetical protein SAMN04489856_1018 [Oleiphilus messinensis]SMP00363.1 hypothetical protein SAMN06264348_1019 [Oceanospirillum linum]